MEIQLTEISIRDLSNGYMDNQENGVVGYFGKLDIRPPFQREFVYNPEQKEKVIDTVKKNFPLNVMYWAVKTNENNEEVYEVIDGQQRTISICQYIDGEFAVKDEKGLDKYFHNLPDTEKEKILNYKLTVYMCKGSQPEKLQWFETINIAGERLFPQELKNAVYSGSWVSNAKIYFSKNQCVAHSLGGIYMTGTPIRQEYLEKVIFWISKGDINNYMAKHQHDPDAKELWLYFGKVIKWVKTLFPNYRKEMKGVEWGLLYNQYSKQKFNPDLLEAKITLLMIDEDVTSKKGIYTYIFDGKEKHLSIRSFTDNQKREAYERQNGICQVCQKPFKIEDMEADHIDPWHEGGKTISSNCQMLCKEDNRRKSGK